MGWDTYLSVGGCLIDSWRKHAPSVPILLFKEENLQIRTNEDEELVVKYRASALEVRKTLRWRGISRLFCERHYNESHLEHGFFAHFSYGMERGKHAVRSEYLAKEYRESGHDAPTPESFPEAEDWIAMQRRGADPAAELRIFGGYVLQDLMKPQLEDEHRDPLIQAWLLDWREAPEVDPIELCDLARDQGFEHCFSIGLVTEFFNDLHRTAPLVCWLILMRVLVDSVDDNAAIELDLSEDAAVSDLPPQEYARNHWEGTAITLAEVANKYSQLFGAIANAASTSGTTYHRRRARALLADCRLQTTNAAKGRCLEDLIAEMWAISGDCFPVVERNLRTAEEELDLVVQVNSADPFWASQRSPCIFVECKNWSTAAGITELRVFESKLQDHDSLCKVGVFVALKGVSAPFRDRLREVQARGRTVFALEESDLAEAIEHDGGLAGWLSSEGLARLLRGRSSPK